MSRASDMVEAVVKRPGMSPRQIGDALGLHWASAVNVVCSQLLQLERAGKLRREGKAKDYRYFPTPISLIDKRFGPRRGTEPKAKQRRRPVLKVQAPAPKPALAARKPQPKPTAAQQLQIVPKKPDITTAASPSATRETVDEFLRRGGRIERLPNGASANPLQTIRTDYDAVNRRRREQRGHESP